MSNISLLLSQASNASFFEPNTCDAPSVRQSFQFQRVSPFSSHQKSRNISNPVGIVPPRRSISAFAPASVGNAFEARLTSRRQERAETMTLAKITPNSVSLAGEFAVLSQLALRGYDANMTLGRTKSVDTLVSNPANGHLYQLEVKTNFKNNPKRNMEI